MRNNDLSNLPASAVAFNVGALCILPEDAGVVDRLFKRAPGSVALHTPATLILNRLLHDGYNMLILIERPALTKFVDNMIKDHNLPITKAYQCPDFDHYSLITKMYRIERTLWVSDELPFHRDEIMHAKDPQGWYQLYDYLKESEK